MAFINRIEVDEDTGRCFVTTDAPSGDEPFMNGIRYTDDDPPVMYVQDVAVGSPFSYQEGIARDDDGVMFVRIDDAPTGSEAVFLNGMLADITGRLSMTTVNPIDTYMHGWPLDVDGSVCIIGVTPPPPAEGTFTQIRISAPLATDLNVFTRMAFFKYGVVGTGPDGFSQDEATFLAAHPGYTDDDLSTYAPGGSFTAIPLGGSTFGPFTVTRVGQPFGTNLPINYRIYGVDAPFPAEFSANWTGNGATPVWITITFATAIDTFAFNFATSPIDTTWTFALYNGATLVATSPIVFTPFPPSSMAAFAGYHLGSGAPPSTNYYDQQTNTDSYEQESSTDKYIQE